LAGIGAVERFKSLDEGGAIEGGHEPGNEEVAVTSYKI